DKGPDRSASARGRPREADPRHAAAARPESGRAGEARGYESGDGPGGAAEARGSREAAGAAEGRGEARRSAEARRGEAIRSSEAGRAAETGGASQGRGRACEARRSR